MCGDAFIPGKLIIHCNCGHDLSDTQKKITIAIMDTACGDHFIRNVVDGSHLLLVTDEVHRIGSPARRNILKINAGERLGLSATPIRYGDPEGTAAEFSYILAVLYHLFFHWKMP